MRLITKAVYSIQELDENAQQRAHESWWQTTDYPYWSDNRASIDAFLGLFDAKSRYISYGNSCKSSPFGIQFDFANDSVGDLLGKRAHAYLQNNAAHRFRQQKVYKKGDKTRKSKILLQDHSCPLTGFYVDDMLWVELSRRIKEIEFTSLREVLYGTLITTLRELQKDYDNYFSPENFREECITYDWEFFVDGEIYC